MARWGKSQVLGSTQNGAPILWKGRRRLFYKITSFTAYSPSSCRVLRDYAHRWRHNYCAILKGLSPVKGYHSQSQQETMDTKNRETLLLLLDRMPIGCIVWTPEFLVESWNPVAERIFGYIAAEAKGKHPYDFIVPEGTRAQVDEVWRRLLDGDSVVHSVNENVTKDGRIILCDWFNTPLKHADGSVIGGLSLVQDVSEQKRAEDKLKEQAKLLDIARDAMIIRDMDCKVLYWNRSAERLYGWKAEEAIGRNGIELVFKESLREAAHAAREATLRDGDWGGEFTQVSKDGKEIIVESHWTLVRDNAGEPKAIFDIDTDITEKKKLEQQVLRTQRLDAIGTLASGIAHDLNNIFGPILLSVQMLREKATDKQSRKTLDTLEKASERGAGIVKQILSIARKTGGDRSLLDLNQVIEELKAMIQETFPRSIQFQKKVADGLWPILGDPTQLHQLLMNLSLNARDAMPQGGTLSIDVENVVLDEMYAQSNPEAKPGHYVLLRVADTGVGIPQENLKTIFEPFFTTKEIGKGTGLGLTSVLQIARNHGGFVSVYSEANRGTSFTVYLPADPSQSMIEVEESVRELPRGNGELLLIIDDEVAVREILKATLETFGYKTLCASDGAEALALFAQHKDEIALVLADTAMPIMDGPTTIRALRRIDSGVKVITMSGLVQAPELQEDIADSVKAVLHKPFTAEKLLTTVATTLKVRLNPKPLRTIFLNPLPEKATRRARASRF
jgi:two-component system cell cycle sensor histidine kinase/response regulator CckA